MLCPGLVLDLLFLLEAISCLLRGGSGFSDTGKPFTSQIESQCKARYERL